MKEVLFKFEHKKLFFSIIVTSVLALMTSTKADAQELPPRPITVTVSLSQSLNFGAFCIVSAGGSVIVYPDGSRSSTGDIVLVSLGYLFSAALFEVEANEGTIISILSGAGTESILTGDTGETMTMQVGDSNPLSPFVISVNPPDVTQVTVGATLFVGDIISNPPGNYSGSFSVTFVQE